MMMSPDYYRKVILSQREAIADIKHQLHQNRDEMLALDEWNIKATKQNAQMEKERVELLSSVRAGHEARDALRCYKIIFRFITVLSFVKNFKLKKRLHEVHTNISALIHEILHENALDPTHNFVDHKLEEQVIAWRKKLETGKRLDAQALIANLAAVDSILRSCMNDQRESKLKWKLICQGLFQKNGQLKQKAMDAQEALLLAKKESDLLEARNLELRNSLKVFQQKAIQAQEAREHAKEQMIRMQAKLTEKKQNRNIDTMELYRRQVHLGVPLDRVQSRFMQPSSPRVAAPKSASPFALTGKPLAVPPWPLITPTSRSPHHSHTKQHSKTKSSPVQASPCSKLKTQAALDREKRLAASIYERSTVKPPPRPRHIPPARIQSPAVSTRPPSTTTTGANAPTSSTENASPADTPANAEVEEAAATAETPAAEEAAPAAATAETVASEETPTAEEAEAGGAE